MRIPNPPWFQYVGWLSSMPFITFLLCYIMYDDRLFDDWRIWAIAYPIIYGIGFISWRSHYIYDNFIRSKYPSLKDTQKRIFATVPVYLLVMAPSVLLIFYSFDWLNIIGYSIQPGDLRYGFLVGLGVNIVFESLWEVIYIIDKYKEAAADQERIEQMHLEQEFENLKTKLNPHFLFNSFNTLSSLISENKHQAEKFLDELSKVYRYLLRSNESGMSTVEQETKFISSYAKLLETRYGDGFKMNMQIDPALKDKEIPSLTLQLLVENAVKHNVISKQHPMQIDIFSNPEGWITVENNLNKKVRPVSESTGIGLSYIRNKYALMKRVDIIIEETAGKYKVAIPVLS